MAKPKQLTQTKPGDKRILRWQFACVKPWDETQIHSYEDVADAVGKSASWVELCSAMEERRTS
jgi:hypothetical protein